MKKILYICVALLACACSHVEETWLDMNDYSSLDPKTCFIPSHVEENTLTESLLMQCYLPGGETVEEAATSQVRRTSSTCLQNLFKELFSYAHSDNVVSFVGTYLSEDADGNPITLSGRIIVPKDRKVTHIMIVNHYTIGANHEAPSRSFPLEGIFAARGLALVVPDYQGFGVTVNMVHPYLNANLTALNVASMYKAAKPFLKHIGCAPENDDIFIYGYSQGGATAVAVQRYIETHYPEEKIRLTLAGGGPYDICATYDQMIAEDNTDYPCVIPMIIQGLNESMHLNLDYNEYFSPLMMEHLDDWINSKRYTVDELTILSGSKQVSVLVTEAAQNKVTDSMADLYMAMIDNSMTNNFHPKSPIYLFHSMTDNVVPFVNAANLQAYLNAQDCNVTYNFGDYGIHRMGCIRFLYTTLNLLFQNGDIPKVF